eukprot:COSAG06_NODE_246_length_19169_cov_28.627950_2_plen_89_part_00
MLLTVDVEKLPGDTLKWEPVAHHDDGDLLPHLFVDYQLWRTDDVLSGAWTLVSNITDQNGSGTNRGNGKSGAQDDNLTCFTSYTYHYY